ncbi:hypothetical protein KJ359_013310 [Pestalotiopsis sp. 9143b]|nr:hypothetical protein KJ359_013310 [Pestalotiopsis sp. 9143b]
MPRKKATAPAEEPPSSAPTSSRRQTRSTRSQPDAQQDVPSSSKGKGKIQGNYQPSKVARRTAPPRSQRDESAEVEFSQSQEEGMTQLQGKAGLSRSAAVPATSPIPEDDQLDEEAQEDRLQDVIDFTIHDLASRADRLHDFVKKAELSSPAEISWPRLEKIQESFDEQRQKMTSSKKHFIDPRELHGFLDGLKRSEHAEQALTTLTLANTALLRKFALEISNGKKESQSVLEELDDYFPNMFKSPESAEDPLSEYDLSFRIRCLILANEVKTNTDMSPILLAADLFCDPDAVAEIKETQKQVKAAKELLTEGPHLDIGQAHTAAKGDELNRKHAVNMQTLCTRLSQKNRTENVRALEAAYPEKLLWEDLAEWAGERYQKNLAGPVKDKGKAPMYLSQATQGSRQNPAAASARSSQVLSQVNGSRFRASNGRGDDDRVIDLSRDSDSDEEEEESIVRTGAPRGSYFDGTAVLGSRDRDLIRQHRATPHRTIPPSNQSLVQNPLGNVDTEELVSSFRQFLASQPERQKRPRGEVSAYGDEDEDEHNLESSFMHGDLEGSTMHSRRTGRSLPKRLRMTNSQHVRSGSVYGEPSTSQFSRYREHSIAQSNLGYDDEQVVEIAPEDIPLLTQKARANTRMGREHRPAQRRQKWDPIDSAALIRAIPQFSCGWSQMESENLFMVPRSQQQIRDKARNLKVDFLKADAPLPRGFDGVVLGKKEIDAVQALGRNPFRMENDLDNYGHPVNTVWDPEMELEEQRVRYRATGDHAAD